MTTTDGSVLRLKPALRIAPRTLGGESCYLIEDPLRGRFFRIGPREHAFVTRLPLGIDQAIAAAAAIEPDAPLAPEEAQHILRWLAHEGLLEGAPEAPPPARRGFLNPVVFRLPLINPDAWLERHRATLGWLAGPLFGAAWLLLVMSALVLLAAEFPAVVAASSGVFYPGNWLALALVWLVVKLLHEAFHGIVCKRFGGTVFEAGIVFILFLPIGYVDATSSWRFARRGERIFVALAGLYVELLCAAVGLWAWWWMQPGVVADLGYNAFVVAGVTSLFFNANPLMRFDGYYALADFVDIPNLYAAGRRYVRDIVARVLLGKVAATRPGWSKREVFVRCYGVAAAAWRVTVMVAILLAAAHLFHGAGIVLAAIAALTMVRQSVREWRPVVAGMSPAGAAAGAVRTVLIVSALAATAWLTTWRETVSVPALVSYSGIEAVRAITPGFVDAIAVDPGQVVAAGDRLLELTNPGLVTRRDIALLALEQAELRERGLRQRAEIAAAQEAASMVAQRRAELAALEREVAGLAVRAPRAGQVDAVDLAARLGTFIESGDVLLRVVDPDAKRVALSVPAAALASAGAREARIELPGRPALAVTVTEHAPRAEAAVGTLAFAASHGGPLPVRAVATGGTDSAPTLEYLSPRIEWSGDLEPAAAAALRAGELGVARLEGDRTSVARWVWRAVGDWLAHLVERQRLA